MSEHTEDLTIEPVYLKIILRLLACFGVFLQPIDNKFYRGLAYFYSCLFIVAQFTGTVLEGIKLFLNFAEVRKNYYYFCMLLSYILGSCKCVVLVMQRKALWEKFDKIEKGVFAPNIERGGVLEVRLIKNSIRVSLYQALLIWITVILIVLMHTISILFHLHIDVEFFDVELNATTIIKKRKLPYDVYMGSFNPQHSPLFEVIFIIEVIWVASMALQIASADALIYAFTSLLKAEFLILKNCLETMVERAKERMVKKYGKQDPSSSECRPTLSVNGENFLILSEAVQQEVDKIATECVKMHQELLTLCDETEDVFSYLMLLQFFFSLLRICLCLFQLSVNTTALFDAISLGAYSFVMLYQIFFYCWHGNELRLVSGSVGEFAYNSDWVVTTQKTKKILLLIMMRSQRPCHLTAGKFALLDLVSFVAIVRGGFSYSTVLREIENI